jgi:hypothetical protein
MTLCEVPRPAAPCWKLSLVLLLAKSAMMTLNAGFAVQPTTGTHAERCGRSVGPLELGSEGHMPERWGVFIAACIKPP